jgi:hypothetical protein
MIRHFYCALGLRVASFLLFAGGVVAQQGMTYFATLGEFTQTLTKPRVMQFGLSYSV